MKPPIVISEDYDISVHPSLEQAAAFLEPKDVKDGVYVAYDSEGYILDLSVIIVKKKIEDSARLFL